MIIYNAEDDKDGDDDGFDDVDHHHHRGNNGNNVSADGTDQKEADNDGRVQDVAALVWSAAFSAGGTWTMTLSLLDRPSVHLSQTLEAAGVNRQPLVRPQVSTVLDQRPWNNRARLRGKKGKQGKKREKLTILLSCGEVGVWSVTCGCEWEGQSTP
ncbi:hypothetical protein ElyMa_003156600 [Elysia marginata]|uniref:Uncharacterized protein n=1 Tax=Elysia marginata TaxID=1093978 RepID=A0AAV4IYB7_9GAST|nr:hypothetical protein ElyMa_003156600 [Elysia marginata]